MSTQISLTPDRKDRLEMASSGVSPGDVLKGYTRAELDVIERYLRLRDNSLFLVIYGDQDAVASVMGTTSNL